MTHVCPLEVVNLLTRWSSWRSHCLLCFLPCPIPVPLLLLLTRQSDAFESRSGTAGCPALTRQGWHRQSLVVGTI
jgi:hypothetical protein